MKNLNLIQTHCPISGHNFFSYYNWNKQNRISGQGGGGVSSGSIAQHRKRDENMYVVNDLHTSPNIVWVIKSRRMRLAWHVARMGEERGVYRVLVGKPEGKRPLGRPRRRWVDNIRMDLQEVGCGNVDWIGLAQDRDEWRTLFSAVMTLRVP